MSQNSVQVMSFDDKGNNISDASRSTAALQQFIRVSVPISHSYGGNWGSPTMGGYYGHYDTQQVSGGESGGVQFISGQTQGGDYNGDWSPYGNSYSDDQFAYNTGDTIVPLPADYFGPQKGT